MDGEPEAGRERSARGPPLQCQPSDERHDRGVPQYVDEVKGERRASADDPFDREREGGQGAVEVAAIVPVGQAERG